MWEKQNICSLAISEICGKRVSSQFKVAEVRTIPALWRIRATSANRPVCNAWGWEFQWGWGFRVNKQCGGLSGRRAPSPWGLARPFVAFNPSTLYWKAWGGAWLRLACQLLCVLEFLTDCLHTFGNNTVIPHPQGGWQEWQVDNCWAISDLNMTKWPLHSQKCYYYSRCEAWLTFFPPLQSLYRAN